MTLKLLTKHHLEFLRLKGGCTDSSESTLVKMQHCWKSHVRAEILFLISLLKHAVDIQKKRLNETFLLSTINIQCVNEIIFLISRPKHILWVLKRTVSKKRFF